MRGLSLTQPWASLVAFGEKMFETRSWGTKYRGPVLIHAAFRFPNEARALCDREPWARLLRYRATADLPRGQVLAVATLGWCGQIVEQLEEEKTGHGVTRWRGRMIGDVEANGLLATTPNERLVGDWRVGRWIWQLTNVRELAYPIPARGMLGLWKVPPVLEAAVLADPRALTEPSA